VLKEVWLSFALEALFMVQSLRREASISSVFALVAPK
jgi:hypothetical protein